MRRKNDTVIFVIFLAAVLVAGGLMLLWGQSNSAEQVFEAGFLHYHIGEQLAHDADYAFTEEEQAAFAAQQEEALRHLEGRKLREGTYATDTAAAVFGDFARVELPYTVYGEDHGWFVVLLHDYNGTPEDMAPEAIWWQRRGFQVILPALRGHGGAVEASTFGVFEQYDLYDLLCAIGKNQRGFWYFHGRGSGAAAALLLAANEDYPCRIHGIVAESVYSDLQTLKLEQLKKQFGLGETLVGKFLTNTVKKQLGFDLTTVSIAEAAARSDCSKLFVCGGADAFLPPEHTEAVYAAAAGHKELLTIPAARHRLCWLTDSEAYGEAIKAWLPDQ